MSGVHFTPYFAVAGFCLLLNLPQCTAWSRCRSWRFVGRVQGIDFPYHFSWTVSFPLAYDFLSPFHLLAGLMYTGLSWVPGLRFVSQRARTLARNLSLSSWICRPRCRLPSPFHLTPGADFLFPSDGRCVRFFLSAGRACSNVAHGWFVLQRSVPSASQ
jgi:hypothetical protein